MVDLWRDDQKGPWDRPKAFRRRVNLWIALVFGSPNFFHMQGERCAGWGGKKRNESPLSGNVVQWSTFQGQQCVMTFTAGGKRTGNLWVSNRVKTQLISSNLQFSHIRFGVQEIFESQDQTDALINQNINIRYYREDFWSAHTECWSYRGDSIM